MRQRPRYFWALHILVALLIGFNHAPCANSAAVMSVDLGNEWMKVGVVSPGVPMEIALNKESKRKSPAVLAFRDNIRSFGDDALSAGIKDPSSAYAYLLDLLGKQIDNPIVDLYRKRFPYYNIIGDKQRNTVVFKNGEEKYSVEELVAQMLMKAKEFAEDSTGQPIAECVLIVPGFFGQAERLALISAAQLANLKVLQLLNDYTAVALNYGVFHRAEINDTAQYYLFYDMGAQKTSAALVSYQVLRDKQTKESFPVLHVLGVGYDRTLGGLEIQLRLRDYLAKAFNDMKKTKTDVTTNPRSMAKLFKEAGRLKNVLSANNDHYAQIENLLEDHDFKLQVTRETLEDLCTDIWPRVVKPLQQAIKMSGLSLDVVNQVIIFGGGTRVPKVQELLKNEINQELGKSLNADEAATMGAAYKAADLATGFKVKKFVLRDAIIYPIQVSFERDPGDGASVRQVKRILFGPMNTYPQKKVITFNKHTSDFSFNVNYGDLNHLSEEEVSYIGSLNLSHVELLNVKETLDKAHTEEIDSKGIKAYFTVDDSGVFNCGGAEFVYEKQLQWEEDVDDEGTLARLGSTISKLFSSKDEEAPADDKKPEQTESTDKKEEKPKEDLPKADANQTDDKLKEAKNNTMKIETIKVPIDYRLTVQYTTPLENEDYQKSQEKLRAINKAEEERTQLESAFNALESHVIEAQEKLSIDEYASCITDEEKENILKECAILSEWLYEDGISANVQILTEKLDGLKSLTIVFLARHWEHQERPDALKAFDSMIESAKNFLHKAKNLTKEKNPENDIFTEVEVMSLQKVIDELTTWRKAEVAAQDKLKRNEALHITIKDITERMALLDREVKYLVNKIKIWKPKTTTTKKSRKNKTNETEDESANQENVETQEEQPKTEEDTEEIPELVEEDTLNPSKTEEASSQHTEL